MTLLKKIGSTLSLILIFLTSTYAQIETPIFDYSKRAEYEIGGINIIGAENRDRNAIKSIAGFREGDKINIPSQETSKAIKSLMKLQLFEDVQILVDSIVDESFVYLTMELIERPTLSRFTYTGVKKSIHEELNDIVNGIINKEGIVTEDQKNLVKKKLEEFYIEKGRLNANVEVKEKKDPSRDNSIILEFVIDRGDRVKIKDIVFEGNENFSARKLRKKMKETKRKKAIFKKSKFISKDYEEDKKSLITFYNNNGYKNAKIVSDSIETEKDGDLKIHLKLEEGNVFHIKNIVWKGNSLYTDEYLNAILGISKGDVYNPELMENRLRFSQDGRDISSIYLDDGYLGFQVDPVEVSVENDSIDIEMRIYEGPQFTINNVVINGNDRTHEDVVRREIRTAPGQKFSRSAIIRSQREIINLGYFNPESLGIETPVNQARGTVDIVYNLEERPADQLELSAGYGGFSGLIGTLGVTFNNFSIANVRDRSTWAPLPQGDGQKLSVRLQSNSRFFKSYNISFTEPWLGGKKPRSLTVGAVASSFDYTSLNSGKFSIIRGFAGLGSQLKWPDDFFSSSTTLNLESIKLDNYQNTNFSVKENGRFFNIFDGNFKNFSIQQTFARSSISDPLFPRSGSRVSLTMKFTPPYSLFRDNVLQDPTAEERENIRQSIQLDRGPAVPVTEAELENAVNSIRLADKFEWLEYHKWSFNSEWYFNLVDKLVLKAQAKIGVLGYYNKDLGVTPFERFELGGDGLTNQNNQIQGRDILALRGYEVEDIQANSEGGGTIFNKYTLELRYPLSLNPSSTIYVTGFLQGGNAWSRFRDFNPFEVKKSAGMGLRVFLPMFGLLGFDYGIGFDKNLASTAKWTDYAKFNIIIGFEPE